MGFLQGKKILITGLISDRSIAYGVAKACHAQGAELAFTYQTENMLSVLPALLKILVLH